MGELLQQTILRAELRKQLGGILDIERLLAKVTLGTAGPRDLLALGRSLEKIPALQALLRHPAEPRGCARLHDRLDELPDVANLILEAIADEPPLNLADGGTIRAGFHAELDELRDLSQNGQQYIAQIESARAAAHRHPVAQGALQQCLRLLHRNHPRQPAPGAGRLRAQADAGQRRALHHAGAEGLRAQGAGRRREDPERSKRSCSPTCGSAPPPQAQRIRATAAAVAELDVTAALAQVAAENRYQRPAFSETGEMRILAGRHPVIERLAGPGGGPLHSQRSVPERLEPNLIAIITGPNMGGKSTYLRQAALIAILAQMGSFVPAESASLPLIDRIFTRIGASDNLARGRSTFMVEMTETAVILNTATPRSFIVLDEIGRGTATYDGLALAWAVVEHIHARTRAKTLFATHYHELTELAEQLEGVRNLQRLGEGSGRSHHLPAQGGAGQAPTAATASKWRGWPGCRSSVIERAREVLKLHERTRARGDRGAGGSRGDAGRCRSSSSSRWATGSPSASASWTWTELRPIEALQLLAELQKELKRRVGGMTVARARGEDRAWCRWGRERGRACE